MILQWLSTRQVRRLNPDKGPLTPSEAPFSSDRSELAEPPVPGGRLVARILLSAYACEPGRGSEPALGSVSLNNHILKFASPLSGMAQQENDCKN